MTRAATAIYGLALAIALAPRLVFPARAGDPLSALKLAGYSSHSPILQLALIVIVTVLFAILGERVAQLLAPYRWAEVAYSAACLFAPIALMHFGTVRHVLLIGVVAAAIVAVRRRDPQFTIGDVVLIPAFLACEIAFFDAGFGHTPIAAALRAAIAIFGLRLLLARLKLRFPRRVIYPIIVFAYPLLVMRWPPPISSNFFEDGHDIPVATEMARGERPYVDVVPMHGLIADGGIDFAAYKLGMHTMRTILGARTVVGMLSGVGIYCLVVAATGSAEMGLLAGFLAFCLQSGTTIWVRPSGALFALAAVVLAVRVESRRWFAIAGALTVLAFLVSIDFGIYTAIVAVFAAFRARALVALIAGILAAAIPMMIVFAILGFAGAFIRVTFFEILGAHGVYSVGLLRVPDCLRSPAILQHLASCLEPLTWIIALIGSSVALARSPFRSRPSDAPWLIGVWMVVAAALFVERGDMHFNVVMTPFIVSMLWLLSKHQRAVAGVLAVIVILLAEPMRHVITVVPELRTAPPPALFNDRVNTSIKAARHFAATLPPSDTFVDFTNSALLYPLLGRDLPLRQIEAAAYQSPEAQREVIHRIERNPHIRAALITFPGTNQDVDGISNAARAPMVAEYLKTHFTPAFEEEGVIFWRRVR